MLRWRYALLFATALAILGLGAAWVVSQDRARARVEPVVVDGALPSEGGSRFVLGDPTLIRPDREDYERFAREDAAWRARHAPPLLRRHFAVSAGEWRASPRQLLRDSVYVLVNAERLAEAITLLEGWVERNPRDAQQILELARLLDRVGRTAESLARYREVLALERGGAR